MQKKLIYDLLARDKNCPGLMAKSTGRLLTTAHRTQGVVIILRA